MSSADFIFGNTRLRARLPALMSPGDLEALTGRAPSTIIDSLPGAALPPGAHVQVHAQPGEQEGEEEESAALAAVQEWLRAQLRSLRTVYSGRAGEAVGVLLARHDLADVLALLRGARAGSDSRERLAAVLAVGAVDEEAARDIAAAPDGAAAVARLVAHRLPDPGTAEALPHAWRHYTVNENPNELETTIARVAINHWIATLDRVGHAAGPIREFVGAHSDELNVLVALGSPTGHPPRFLPGGHIPLSRLLGSHTGVLTAASTAHPAWAAALERYAEQGNRAILAADIDAATGRWAMAGLRCGDPLGAAIPLGYVVAVETQARGLRRLIQSARRARSRTEAQCPS